VNKLTISTVLIKKGKFSGKFSSLRRVCYNHESNNNNADDDNTGKTNDCDEKLLSRVVAKPEGSLPLVSKPAISHNSELVPSVTFTTT
jgi:hypothetical protein